MQREPVSFDYRLSKTLGLLSNPGLLLAATGRDGRSNAMVIGWGTVGVVWGVPTFVALVRPSRHTYGLIEDTHEFTVNAPTEELRRFVGVCGSRSGRDIDKFGQYEIATTSGEHVHAVMIDACPLVYECRVVHHNDLLPANLLPDYEARFYGGKDYHRLYFGQILGTYASSEY